MACKVGHKLDQDVFWEYIRTNGGNDIDEPGGVWPNLYMSWTPVYTSKCNMCGDRTKNGDEPFCTYNCPTNALTFGDTSDPQSTISLRIEELKEKGFRIFQPHPWEASHKGIYYAQKATRNNTSLE
jgi:Fe-S-cluster-containing dehydrogenase component